LQIADCRLQIADCSGAFCLLIEQFGSTSVAGSSSLVHNAGVIKHRARTICDLQSEICNLEGVAREPKP
jgi:hypothetical protein